MILTNPSSRRLTRPWDIDDDLICVRGSTEFTAVLPVAISIGHAQPPRLSGIRSVRNNQDKREAPPGCQRTRERTVT